MSYRRLNTPKMRRPKAGQVTVTRVDLETGEILSTRTQGAYDLSQLRTVRSGRPAPKRDARRRARRRKQKAARAARNALTSEQAPGTTQP